MRVVAAYPGGSPDIPSSRDRVAGYTKELREKFGVTIVGSIDELLASVDVVLLESVDGRPHLEQARPVFQARKPVFIDKPVAGSLADAIAIFELARETNTPCFSSSSLRFGPGIDRRASERQGRAMSSGCDAYGPCHSRNITPTCSGTAFTASRRCSRSWAPAARRSSRTQTEGTELVVGVWNDGRVGTFRGMRQGHADYGATVFGSKGNRTQRRLRGLRTPGCRDRQVLQDRQAARERRGDDRDLRLHGSRRREQAPGGQAGERRERDGQGQGPACQVGANHHPRRFD